MSELKFAKSKVMQLYYFAYGSNMLRIRLKERIGKKFEKVGTTTLDNYKLVFDCGAKEVAYANIVPCYGGSVEGVLYKISEEQIWILDHYENYPTNYEKMYFIDNQQRLCFAYISVNPDFKTNNLPEWWYFKILKEGAWENNLIKTFDFLSSFERRYMERRKKEWREWVDF